MTHSVPTRRASDLPEECLDAGGRAFVENQQANRDREARNWWRARAELRAIAEPDRAAFIRYWGRCKCPGNACYLLTYINMFRDGRLIVHEGEVRPRSDVEWERDRKAKIAAMSDLELDVMIQTRQDERTVEKECGNTCRTR